MVESGFTKGDSIIKRGLALFALLFIVVVFVLVPLTNTAMIDQPEGRFSPYSDNYDDLSLFKDDVEASKVRDENDQEKADYDVYSIVASPTILNGPDVEPEKSIYIGVGLERPYGDDEINALLEFFRNGGKAILADDYGHLSEFARYFRVTYYRGKFFDNEFDLDWFGLTFRLPAEGQYLLYQIFGAPTGFQDPV